MSQDIGMGVRGPWRCEVTESRLTRGRWTCHQRSARVCARVGARAVALDDVFMLGQQCYRHSPGLGRPGSTMVSGSMRTLAFRCTAALASSRSH